MDYAQQTAVAERPMPELGRLKAASERIARATNNVENFLRRFHGSGPEEPASSGGITVNLMAIGSRVAARP
jgi:hypothetical protein